MDTRTGRIEYLTEEEARKAEREAKAALQKHLMPKSIPMELLAEKDKGLSDELWGKNREERRKWLKDKGNRIRLKKALNG